MRIATYLNVSPEDIESKKSNLFLGCSLGNNYFTEDHLREYIRWGIENTKENFLIIIPDRIYAINLEILDDYNRERALRVAIRKGNEREDLINKILSTFPKEAKQKTSIAKCQDVENSKYHEYRLKLIMEEFYKKEKFYYHIIDIVKENKKVKNKNLSQIQLEKLAEYILNEIPIFLNGAKYGGKPEEGGKTYSVVVYPGFGKIDLLFDGLQKHTLFPELSKKLKITDEIRILEAYAE